jgi:hypothetical protein
MTQYIPSGTTRTSRFDTELYLRCLDNTCPFNLNPNSRHPSGGENLQSNTQKENDGINCYSFNLRPEDHQPSGGPYWHSGIDTTRLRWKWGSNNYDIKPSGENLAPGIERTMFPMTDGALIIPFNLQSEYQPSRSYGSRIDNSMLILSLKLDENNSENCKKRRLEETLDDYDSKKPKLDS